MKETSRLFIPALIIILTWTVVNSTIRVTSSTEALLGSTATLILTWENEKIYSIKIEHVDSNENHAVCGINPITDSCTSCNNAGNLNNLQSNCSPKRIAWMFSPLRLSNDGMYRITLSRLNDNAIQRTSYIYVHEKPSDVSLKCYYKLCNTNKLSCECVANPGNPKAVFRWTLTRKNKVPIDLTYRSSTGEKYGRIHSALSYDVNKLDHESLLLCETINKYAVIKRDYLIEHREKPSILSNFENHLVLLESSGKTMHCTASGNPQPTIQWKLPDGRFLLKSDLLMSDLLKHQPGIYSCMAHNCMGNDTRQTEIIVQYTPECSSVYNNIIHITENLYGTSLTLMCKIASNPDSKINWTTYPVWTNEWLNLPLKGLIIDEYQEGNYKFSSLTINSTSIRNFGTYKCHATNFLGSCSETIQIRKAEDKEYNKLKAENEENKLVKVVLSLLTVCLGITLIVITALYVQLRRL